MLAPEAFARWKGRLFLDLWQVMVSIIMETVWPASWTTCELQYAGHGVPWAAMRAAILENVCLA